MTSDCLGGRVGSHLTKVAQIKQIWKVQEFLALASLATGKSRYFSLWISTYLLMPILLQYFLEIPALLLKPMLHFFGGRGQLPLQHLVLCKYLVLPDISFVFLSAYNLTSCLRSKLRSTSSWPTENLMTNLHKQTNSVWVQKLKTSTDKGQTQCISL